MSLIGRRCHRHTCTHTHGHKHMHAFTHSCEHIHAHAPRETLWEVISLPVPAMPGQPSGAATSLCPSVPRLALYGLPASRERERERESLSISSKAQTTHTDAQRAAWSPMPSSTNKKILQQLQQLIHSLPFSVHVSVWCSCGGCLHVSSFLVFH